MELRASITEPVFQKIKIPIGVFLMITITLLICLWGLVGNGGTISLLGVRIKRNNFLTYFLNLSIADFGVLIGLSCDNPYVYEYAYICSSLNSTINPLIYFLVGRDKSRTSRMKIKVIFGKVFKEEESHGKNIETSVTTKSDV
ncbi:mas-related G-protein coupled receptor member H-like [Pseudonaja textilis]|uniref:mas-related G-protein coupled receptor member H-like n=1 Tax=Pseudonaja textilis TaxID=8673 RepID=UPI000EAA8E46|nr:mas-related G-protein coupled receptor member H-like [Pseudonaja textilis]